MAGDSPRPSASALVAEAIAHVEARAARTANAMEEAAAALAFDSNIDAPSEGVDVVPIGNWRDVGDILDAKALELGARRLPTGEFAVDLDVALRPGEIPSAALLIDSVGAILRADSPDAPATHGAAVKAGEVWMQAEGKELGNHHRNGSWVLIPRSEVPRGRRIHKLIWVYKVKRDGSAKARLCVDGSSMAGNGIDYDQTFSDALKYESARSLFALAARLKCKVHSIDLVAAYLQGEMLEGESVYCFPPAGHETKDADGNLLFCEIVKPVYGMPQSGRRLQRKLYPWL